MTPLDTAGKRAIALIILLALVIVLDLIVGGIVAAEFGTPFKFSFADAFVASIGVLFIYVHWVVPLVYFALLIIYQHEQNTNNDKDFWAYIGGVIVAASLLTIINFIWKSDEEVPRKRGYMSVQDSLEKAN